MEIAQGTVSNCQHTLKVSGGANNTSTTTTYIALFRINGHPVEFRSSAPSSLSDGDQVKVAGPMYRGALNALACRNLTTGETMNSGLWGYVFGVVLIPVIGTVLCLVLARQFGTLALLIAATVTVAITAYVVHRALLTNRAIDAVRA